MKILLFGSTGVIGTAMESACEKAGIKFVGLSHADIEVKNYQAIEDAIDRHTPDVVVNCVALVGISPCELDPDLAFQINTTPVMYMARACNERDIHFVQFSSHAVFDGTKEEPYTEDDKPVVMSIYAGSKYLADCFARNYCHYHYVLRLPTMFGPRRNNKPGFVDKMVARIRAGETLRIADDHFDTPTYALDVAHRLISLLQEKSPSGLYHLANAGYVSYYDFIRALVKYMSADVEVIRAKEADFVSPKSPGYKPLRTGLASVKLPPMRPWEEALKEYVDNYLLNDIASESLT